MAEYTITSAVAAVAVVLAELCWFETGVFKTKAYWIAFAIVIFFQVLVDGWLTKLSDPIVIYDDRFNSGLRFPFDIPIEDYLFGFALVTLATLLWIRGQDKQP